MGVFSIWHWLIVLLALIAVISIPVFAVISETSQIKIKRKEFLFWIAAWFGILIVTKMLSSIIAIENFESIGGLVFYGLMYPVYQRIVRRARDAGMGKLIAYLSIIPGVNLPCFLILLFKKSVIFEVGAEIR